MRYRTVLLAVVVFGGETGTLMTLARQKTNWAAHLYVYLAVLSLGIALLYFALTGPDRAQTEQGDGSSESESPSSLPPERR
jgi:hypothetical protein